MHLNYGSVSMDDPANTVWTEGNTTYVFVPTENLPLLAPLRLMGMDKLADALNEPLKEIMERAYDRPYLTPTGPAEDATAEPAADDDSADRDPGPGDRRLGRHRAGALRHDGSHHGIRPGRHHRHRAAAHAAAAPPARRDRPRHRRQPRLRRTSRR